MVTDSSGVVGIVGQGEAGLQGLFLNGFLLVVRQRSAVGVGAVGQRLAVSYLDGTVVALSGDVVGGVAQTEDDGAVVGTDARVAGGGSGNLATIDGDVAVGVNALGVDCAAIDGDAVNTIDANIAGTGGVDCAAVDGDVVIDLDGNAGVGGSRQCARALALAVDVQRPRIAVDGIVTIIRPRVRHGHRLTVAEDEVHVAVDGDGVVEGDVATYEVPRILSILAEAVLSAVEGDGAGNLLRAVGVDVSDVVGLAVAAQGSVDGHVLIGHSERIGILLAAQRTSCSSVLIEGISSLVAVAQRQAHLVAAASVIYVIILDARRVSCDATDAVFGTCTETVDGHILTCRDAMACLALRVAEGLGVVAVGDGGAVACEGGAAVGFNGILAFGDGCWCIEAVADIDRAAAPAYEAAAFVGQFRYVAANHAVEQATLNGDRAAAGGGESAVGAVVVDTAGDGDAAAAVADGYVTVVPAYESRSAFVGGGDGARGVQARNRCPADIAERSGVFAHADNVDVERIVVAVEMAAEGVVARAHHRRDADAGAQLEVLVAIALAGSDIASEVEPASRRGDDIWMLAAAVGTAVDAP